MYYSAMDDYGLPRLAVNGDPLIILVLIVLVIVWERLYYRRRR